MDIDVVFDGKGNSKQGEGLGAMACKLVKLRLYLLPAWNENKGCIAFGTDTEFAKCIP
jgi:hypothetical protein